MRQSVPSLPSDRVSDPPTHQPWHFLSSGLYSRSITWTFYRHHPLRPPTRPTRHAWCGRTAADGAHSLGMACQYYGHAPLGILPLQQLLAAASTTPFNNRYWHKTLLTRTSLRTRYQGCQTGPKSANGLLLAPAGSLKLGFGALLLSESLATTSGDLKGWFLLNTFLALLLKNQSIHRRKTDYPSSH